MDIARGVRIFIVLFPFLVEPVLLVPATELRLNQLALSDE
ncbi:hypothetical Protein YC6258_04191 [Gynuella sunshinyii YC6258]|uniref:Uncharacterized protein n=1 Tax=Gynuella sunshinyii YC6258 TaxID=1445510 RepID=A0A0C5W0M0_9GAMM|nr:hypothetical Protein YC6258_04191 [Gynuella sunshinyii YC6258]